MLGGEQLGALGGNWGCWGASRGTGRAVGGKQGYWGGQLGALGGNQGSWGAIGGIGGQLGFLEGRGAL